MSRCHSQYHSYKGLFFKFLSMLCHKNFNSRPSGPSPRPFHPENTTPGARHVNPRYRPGPGDRRVPTSGVHYSNPPLNTSDASVVTGHGRGSPVQERGVPAPFVCPLSLPTTQERGALSLASVQERGALSHHGNARKGSTSVLFVKPRLGPETGGE